MSNPEEYKKNLETLQRLMACLNAQEDIMGRGAIGLLYQSGRDVGITDGKSLDQSDDIATAIKIIENSQKHIWTVELWSDAGKPKGIFEEDGYKKVNVVFRECPIRQVCISQGVKQDGAMCRLAFGYYAGLLSTVMNKKVDLLTIQAGPNACKKELRWR